MRRALALILVAVFALGSVPVAHADGDPASDALLISDAFYPYRPNLVSTPLKQAMDKMLKASKAKGFELRVAVIAAQTDLGSVPQLFTEPQQYANLLTREITFNNKPRVLVVLPSGLGGNNLGDNAGPALAKITPPTTGGSDALTRTAMEAIAALTRANGTPIAAPTVTSAPKRKEGGTSPVLTFGLPVALIAIVAIIAAFRARGSDDDEDDDEPDHEDVVVTRIPAEPHDDE